MSGTKTEFVLSSLTGGKIEELGKRRRLLL